MIAQHFYHVIKDPVHGTMQFTTVEDKWVKPFIDSQNFQRLRHIKQLGLSDLVFPGAVHTRFNHSIGCCYVGGQIAHKIGLSDPDRQIVMLAALLHDIGHGPFSHTFEKLFNPTPIRHEDWTPFFLADYSQETFFDSYNTINPGFAINHDKFKLMSDMIMHQTGGERILADIVSSQLDADRLDYLLRDSHFCGVAYGQFDFRWMLHCLAIVNTPHGERLGITYKGIGAVEHYLMARRLMLRNIYYSQKNLCLEALLVELLTSFAVALQSYKPFAVFKPSSLGQFLMACHRFNHQAKQSSDPNLKRQFITEQFSTYQQLCDYDVYQLINALAQLTDNHPAVTIAKRIKARQIPKIIRLDDYDLTKVKDHVKAFKARYNGEFANWQLLLIQTPHQSYSGDEDPIWVINEQGTVKTLGQMSMMINALANKLEHIAFLAVDKAIVTDSRIVDFLAQLA
jgi:uncharacterized protein